MTIPTRWFAAACALMAATSVQADGGGNNGNNDLRVAVVVNMTPEGRKVPHPTPDSPAYYVPVVVGYKELGDHLQDFQRPPPPPAEVQRQLIKALADQGYLPATTSSPPSLVIVFRWGYIAPQILDRRFLNRDEMMTYVIGDNWSDLAAAAGHSQSDSGTASLFSEINAATDSSLVSTPPTIVPFAQDRTPSVSSDPPDMSPTGHLGARYFLMVSALDFQASQRHKSVLLWRAHVSVNYWGHYLDESLPALIAAAAPLFGRETLRPVITPASIVPLGRVIVGTPAVVSGGGAITLAPTALIEDRMQAEAARKLDQFSAGAESTIMGTAGQTLAGQVPSETEEARAPEAPRDASAPGVVRLPPYIVADHRKHTPWLYAAIPGYEILSATTLQDTQRFAEMMYREKRWLDEIAPPSLQGTNTVPTALILLTEDFRAEFSGKITALFQSKTGDDARPLASTVSVGLQPFAEQIPQVKLNDQDSMGADILLDPGKTDVALDPEFVFRLLGSRVPSLPPWFIVGVAGLWRDWVEGYYKDLQSTVRYTPLSGETFHLPPMGSLDAWKVQLLGHRIRGGGLAPLPIETILGAPPDDVNLRALWAAESDLFVRWALDDKSGGRRESLWRLADMSSSQPVSEAMFRECFGLDFRQALKQLDSFVDRATASDLTLVPLNPVNTPWIDPQRATDSEVARILGDWQRKEIGFVNKDYPQLAGEYASQAGETLNSAYEEGNRDCDLLAALGLYECAIGDDRRARSYLEPAVSEKVRRPQAYVELARIRLEAALKRPDGSHERLDRAQAASILGLVQAARALDPPQADGFLLAADTWEHADFIPSPADLKLLDEGLYYFPREARLVLAAAQLDAAAGLRTRAVAVLDGGLQNVSDPRLREAFAYLRHRYTSPSDR